MFGLAGRLFGVSITAADRETEIWNPDVRFFSIKDKVSGGQPRFSVMLFFFSIFFFCGSFLGFGFYSFFFRFLFSFLCFVFRS